MVHRYICRFIGTYVCISMRKDKINGMGCHQSKEDFLHDKCHIHVGSPCGDVSVHEAILVLFKVGDKRACTQSGLAFRLNFPGEFDYMLTYNCGLVSNNGDNYFN